MTERKIQAKPITARVRIRSTIDVGERDQHMITRIPSMQYRQPTLPSLAHVSKSEKYAQQIKELLRLNDILRIGLSLDEILQQIINSATMCTGFRALAMYLVDENGATLSPVAFSANIPEEDKRDMIEHPKPISLWGEIMRTEFQVSQSYFISHKQTPKAFDQMPGSVTMKVDERSEEQGRWHPNDMFFTPLYSVREESLLGFISLDDPENGAIPDQESTEIIELFASKAAMAIDNVRVFQERETERVLLEHGMSVFYSVLQKLQGGDFRVVSTSVDTKFQPMTDTINTAVSQLNNLLQNMRVVIKKANDGAHSMQIGVGSVTNDMLQQSLHMRNVSDATDLLKNVMGFIVGEMGELDRTVKEVVEVVARAQEEVDRSIEGMREVREMTKRSERSIKAFGESGQSLNETIEVLEDLAMRMHLVSLNTAIEANRAGESGQSFLAIAQELRTLASFNTEGVRKMRDAIGSMDQETMIVSQSIEKSMEQVVMQTELVTDGGVTLETARGELNKLSSQVQNMQLKTDGQLQSTQLITSSIADVLDLNERVTQHAQDLQGIAHHLAEMTQTLNSRISFLKLRGDE